MQIIHKPFLKLLLYSLGYMLMGNLLAFIMTISLSAFGTNEAVMGMATLFAMAIYLLLVSVPAFKDGQSEACKQNRTDEDAVVPNFYKNRWIIIGVILWVIMLVPSIVFLFGGISAGWYRFINGAVYPLSLFLVQDIDGGRVLMSSAPYVIMVFYVLTIPACLIGHKMGRK